MRTQEDRRAWLAQRPEQPLDTTRRIVDPHHHLWQRPDHSYRYAEFAADTAGWAVEATVFVECSAGYRSHGPEEERSLGETEFAAAEGAASRAQADGPKIAGIVAFVDLRLGARLAPILRRHQEASEGLLCGVRHSASWDPHPEIPSSHSGAPPDLYCDPEFRRGVTLLGEHGLVCDTWQYFHQLSGHQWAGHPVAAHQPSDDVGGLVGLARVAPATTVVVDHCGGPLIGGPYASRSAEVYDHWRRGIDQLAACPNVVIKLGGISMPRNGFDWHLRDRPPSSEELAEAMVPWITHSLAAFGDRRAMFASNFPVDKVSCSYTTLWNAFTRLVSSRSEASKDRLFAANARRIYGLGLRGTG